MKLMKLLAVAALVALPLPAIAADVSVDMLNKHPETNERNVFYPAVVRIDSGDTVNWLATDRGHNVEFVRGATPDGVKAFRSKLNKDVSFTFTEPGVYVYKCTPHYGQGMVGIVVVGDAPADLQDLRDKRFPGKAGSRIRSMLDEIG